MTTKSSQLISLQQTFHKISMATADIFDHKSKLKYVKLIPLFEEVETMADSDKILEEYLDYLWEDQNYKPSHLRVFIARSDPAMNAGLLPAMLACKHAISSYHEFGKSRDIEIFPWIGGGSLPFRGGINPDNVEYTINEYKGTASLTIQTAFRNDYSLDKVKSAIAEFNEKIPGNRKKYRVITKEEGEAIKRFNLEAKKFFQSSVEPMAPLINQVADLLPSHRERVQHVGIFGYARGMGKVKLPRAIKFTGAFYSLGIPPEMIGTGRALKLAQEMGILDLVKELYVNLNRDLEHAGHYFNPENLELLAAKDSAFKDVRKDIELVEKMLDLKISPLSTRHIIHRNLTSNIYHKINLGDFDDYLQGDILRAAETRKSLG